MTAMSANLRPIPRPAISRMFERETARFAASNPRSAALAKRASAHLPHGVPMHWMLDWGIDQGMPAHQPS